MSAINALCVTFVVLATIVCCHTLRIRRSGVAGYDDPYGLTNALGAIERSQRANYDSYLNRGFPNEEESYFNPNTDAGYELSPIDYLSAIGYNDNADDSLMEYPYGRAMPSYRQFGKVPIMFDEKEAIGYGPQKRTAFNPRRVVPTIDELRTLFGEADVPMKRLSPVKRRQPELNGAISSDDTAHGDANSDKAQLSKQWGKLINAAEQLTMNNIQGQNVKTDSSSVNDDDSNTDNMIHDELEEAFSDAEVEDNGDEMTTETDDEVIKGNGQPQSKSKRASSGHGDTSDYILALLKDISDLKAKVSVLEMKQLLEDRENDFLANALKYSTFDQMNEDSEYVKEEFSNIAKATKIEELIQQFSDAVEDDGEYNDEDGEFNPGDISESNTMKRSNTDIEESEGEWLETPVQESVKGEAFLKDEGDDDVFTAPEASVSSYVDDEIDGISGNDVMENAVTEALSDRREEDAADNKELLLARLINNLSPDTVQEILTDLQNQPIDTDVSSNEICPAVMELSQNCAFADDQNIPLDDEARNLCIRHQLCYTCGEALDISASRCDGGYKGTVIAECEGDVSCVRSAAYFLQLMTSRYHEYTTYSPDQCLNSCVKDFIFGVA